MSRTFSVVMDDATAQQIEEMSEEFEMSYSNLIEQMCESSIEDGDLWGMTEVIPDAVRRRARKEQARREMMARQEEREMRASFEDRILGCFRKRLEGDAAYHPELMRGPDGLTEGYREDARIEFDDDDEIAKREAKVDHWMQIYEAGYWARERAERVDTELNTSEVNGWFGLGRDVYRLRDRIEDVVARVREIANGETGWDSDAVLDALADEFSVSTGAVALVVDSLSTEDVDRQEMLALGGDGLASNPTLALADGGPSSEPEPLPEDAEVRSNPVTMTNGSEPTGKPGAGFDQDEPRDGRELDEDSVAASMLMDDDDDDDDAGTNE